MANQGSALQRLSRYWQTGPTPRRNVLIGGGCLTLLGLCGWCVLIALLFPPATTGRALSSAPSVAPAPSEIALVTDTAVPEPSVTSTDWLIPTDAPEPSITPIETFTPLPTLTPLATLAGLGIRTKASGCIASGGLPDPDCTPGAIFPDATTDQICTPGYSTTVRNVPDDVKAQVYAEYGIATHSPGQYEVDHLIPLTLGGSNDIANLWPEPANPRPGYNEKDTVELRLHDRICSGAMSLQVAQLGIAQRWLSFYTAPAASPTAPKASGHRFVASSKAKKYYYCDTDPAWRDLSPKNLVWSNTPDQFIAIGLVLHAPCQ